MLHARDQRLAELLQAIARGGLSDQQRERIERELTEVRESMRREREWARLTRASLQPRFRTYDPY
jgi:anti-sigma factor RsiW